MPLRPVAFVTALKTASLASEPEWPNQTLCVSLPGKDASSLSAKATAGSFEADRMLAPAGLATARDTASTIAGWP